MEKRFIIAVMEDNLQIRDETQVRVLFSIATDADISYSQAKDLLLEAVSQEIASLSTEEEGKT